MLQIRVYRSELPWEGGMGMIFPCGHSHRIPVGMGIEVLFQRATRVYPDY